MKKVKVDVEMESDDSNISRNKNPEYSLPKIGWWEAISAHLIAMVPFLTLIKGPKDIDSILSESDKENDSMKKDFIKYIMVYNGSNRNVLLMAWLWVIGATAFIALSLQSIIDGPQVILSYLHGEFLVESQLMKSWAVYGYLLIWAFVLVIGILIPYLMLKLMVKNSLELEDLGRKINIRNIIFLISAYSILPVIFFSGLVTSIALFTISDSFEIHLNFYEWQNYQYYILALLILFGTLNFYKQIRAYLGIPKYKAIFIPFFTFLLIALTVLLPILIF